MRVIWWGTYDLGKPRVRIMLEGARRAGLDIIEIHRHVWSSIEDKSQVRGRLNKLQIMWRWLAGYPRLLWRYLQAPPHDLVVVGYLGHVDVLLLWCLAKLRRKQIVLDMFIPLHDTLVADRTMISERGWSAKFVWFVEYLACRAADLVLADTEANAEYLRRTYGLAPDRVKAVHVGVEEKAFREYADAEERFPRGKSVEVLFYGQFIPLHGVGTIIDAARLLADEPVRWTIIGSGQEDGWVREQLNATPLPKLTWIPWVPYAELRRYIAGSAMCLGIFGGSRKASAVIPNKVFQCVAAGKPIITRDSPAIRELLDPADPGVILVPPEDSRALADAVITMLRRDFPPGPLHRQLMDRISEDGIGASFVEALSSMRKMAREFQDD